MIPHADLIWSLVEKVRGSRPLVHCITNYVTVNDCANALLAAGAAPVMSHAEEETAEVTAHGAALLLNLGATEYYPSMYISGDEARRLSIPAVIDPVGVGGSSYRRREALEMIKRFRPAAVRGNLSEIRALITGNRTTSGVDIAEADRIGDVASAAAAAVSDFARTHGAIVIASGASDIITDGRVTWLLKNGSPLMSRITGSGCMSSAVLGAFMAAERSAESAAAACALMSIAGEIAGEQTEAAGEGPGSFRVRLIDNIYLMNHEEIAKRLRISQVTGPD